MSQMLMNFADNITSTIASMVSKQSDGVTKSELKQEVERTLVDLCTRIEFSPSTLKKCGVHGERNLSPQRSRNHGHFPELTEVSKSRQRLHQLREIAMAAKSPVRSSSPTWSRDGSPLRAPNLVQDSHSSAALAQCMWNAPPSSPLSSAVTLLRQASSSPPTPPAPLSVRVQHERLTTDVEKEHIHRGRARGGQISSPCPLEKGILPGVEDKMLVVVPGRRQNQCGNTERKQWTSPCGLVLAEPNGRTQFCMPERVALFTDADIKKKPEFGTLPRC